MQSKVDFSRNNVSSSGIEEQKEYVNDSGFEIPDSAEQCVFLSRCTVYVLNAGWFWQPSSRQERAGTAVTKMYYFNLHISKCEKAWKERRRREEEAT